MENNKPTGTTKHISKLIEEAKQKGIEVIVIGENGSGHIGLIGAGDSGVVDASALMALAKEKKNAVIVIEDIDKILEQEKNPAFERPPIPIINTHEPLPEIKLRREDNKQWYEKLSPSKKRRKW